MNALLLECQHVASMLKDGHSIAAVQFISTTDHSSPISAVDGLRRFDVPNALAAFSLSTLDLLHRKQAHNLRLDNPSSGDERLLSDGPFPTHAALLADDFLAGEDPSGEQALADAYISSIRAGGLYDGDGGLCAAEPLDVLQVDLPTTRCVPIRSVLMREATPACDDVLSWLATPPEKHQTDARRKRVWAKPGSWEAIVRAGAGVGLFVPVLPSEVACDASGVPKLGGAFGIAKKTGKQRLIIDLGCNGSFDPPPCNDLALPYGSMYVLLHLENGESAVFNGDDDRNCFYAHGLTDALATSRDIAWSRYFCIRQLVPLSLFWELGGRSPQMLPDLAGDTLVFASICALPMGWEYSVAIVQFVQRHIASLAGIDPSRELRSDRPFPFMSPSSSPVYGIYVDNFDEIDIVKSDSIPPPTISTNQQKLQQVKDELGIPMNMDKRVAGALKTDLLGFEMDGQRGLVATPTVRRRVLFRIAFMLMMYVGRSGPDRARLRGYVGKWMHSVQVRRPLLSVFSDIFGVMPQFSSKLSKWLPPSKRWCEGAFLELVVSAGVLPFMYSDLRTPFHSELVATDASLVFGAVCTAPISNCVSRALLACVDFRGGNINLNFLPPQFQTSVALKKNPNNFQLSFDPSDFHFKFQFNFAFRFTEHITLLECRVVLAFLRSFSLPQNAVLREGGEGRPAGWLAGRKVFFLPDNQPSGLALAKGRSGSRRLNGVLRHVCFFLITKAIQAYQAWTGTTLQPADQYTRIVAGPLPFNDARVRAGRLQNCAGPSFGRPDILGASSVGGVNGSSATQFFDLSDGGEET